MFEVLDKIDGTVAGSDDAQVQGDIARLVAHRLKGGNLNAAGQDGLKVFHGQRPGEGLFVEELVERGDLAQQQGVGRLPHHVLVALPLAVDGVDPGLHVLLGRAGHFGLLVEGPQSQAKANGNHRQRRHGDAQALEGRPDVGVGAGGEIECDLHQAAPASAPTTPARLSRLPSGVAAPVSGRGARSATVSSGSSIHWAKSSAALLPPAPMPA